ncbi:DUF805 domain-containing protein [Streptomyces sp. NRRL F-5126]|uniref:DUF805 domain-containing protein n=1 Tax=Streptomyces sp. NRRL F-5126 TaxID=1463857 RepID=UPI000A5426F4|nr:DUF805 domain-containing protein [Streptomyces sp. NRRL F-5126]
MGAALYWYIEVLKKYSVFTGRARRRELWIYAVVSLVAAYVVGFAGSVAGISEHLEDAYGLAVLVPTVAVLTRRLHDTGRSAWWLLVPLVPLVGTLLFLVVLCLGGDGGGNRYGAAPGQAGPVSPSAPAR